MAPPADLTRYLLLVAHGGIGFQILLAPAAPAVLSLTTAKSALACVAPAVTEECGQCALEIDRSVSVSEMNI